MMYFDVTRPLSPETLIYPGDIRPEFIQKDTGPYVISDIHISTHSGTHIDSPRHYLKAGATIDTVPLSNLIGRCRVLDMKRTGKIITSEHLINRITSVERLFLKTAFSGSDLFSEGFPSLSFDAAKAITSAGIKCVGIDSPSIEEFRCDGSVHRELLSHGCCIIELLDLSSVSEGDYLMVALPLRLAGLDGSPARVILITEGGG